MNITVIGRGNVGSGLADRWEKTGHAVTRLGREGGDASDIEQQKKIVADLYTGVGWEVPRLIEAMWDAPDFYFDSISRFDMDCYSTGRVVLLGYAG